MQVSTLAAENARLRDGSPSYSFETAWREKDAECRRLGIRSESPLPFGAHWQPHAVLN
jgi:hypothetical protein